MSTATIQDEDIKFQRENWEMIRSHVSPIISNLTMDNLQESHRDLFQVNILIGRNIICKNVVDFTLNKQNGRLIPALSALIALLNSDIPDIGETLAKRTNVNVRAAIQSQRLRVLRKYPSMSVHFISL